VPHGAFNSPDQNLKARTQGNVQIACTMLINVLSWNLSLNHVIPSNVMIPATVDGIVRRFVWNWYQEISFFRKGGQLNGIGRNDYRIEPNLSQRQG
jgi:hypothetical protein